MCPSSDLRYTHQVSTTLKQDLATHFGFDEFRPGQEKVIGALLDGRSALAVFPTGGGKSLCYQLPALRIQGLTVVVSPLIALMKDQIDFLQKRGISAARLDSSLTAAEVVAVNESIQNGSLKLLYVAPERFNNERFVGEMKRAQIGLFAIDEAHCISEWGHNFRPDYLKLAEIVKSIGAERVLALTATATPTVVADICNAFEIPQDDSVVTGFYRPNLTLLTTPVTDSERDSILVTKIKDRKPATTIIYVTLQKTAEAIAQLLSANQLPARAYHAGMDADLRNEVQEWWMAEPNGIVVATIAFGMGIDKRDVRYVYHYNLPKSLENYSQEIGRAGRDNEPSIVEMLACPRDIPTLENFTYGDTPSTESIRALVEAVASWSPEEPVPVSTYDLANRLDLRGLVLKTALTYLELNGTIQSGTPVYTGYDLKPLRTIPELSTEFPGVHGEFVKQIFDSAKRGRIWYSLNPDDVAQKLDVERRRIIRVIEVLEQKSLIEVKAGDVRTPYFRSSHKLHVDGIVAELMAKFEKRERQEMERLQQVIDLIELNKCQVNALVAYFGESRKKPCGHCSWCLSGLQQKLPSDTQPKINVDFSDVRALFENCPESMQTPKHVAKFLCGLTSPALTKTKLSKHPLFGVLEHHRFSEVTAWCASQLTA